MRLNENRYREPCIYIVDQIIACFTILGSKLHKVQYEIAESAI